mmetsp:Transcript_5020/g.8338  ORF Transcript_5020/g.8338 Transcript_5020/m.8338 type:complete len:1579 (-) Transcript_5020:342-5078(-)
MKLLPCLCFAIGLYFAVLCGASGLKSNKSRYEPYDGYWNNLAVPGWGRKNEKMQRVAPYAYKDSVLKPNGVNRKSAREISNLIFHGPGGMQSRDMKTILVPFYALQLADEVIDAGLPGCPPELFFVPIPKCDPIFDPGCEGTKILPYRREAYDPETGHHLNNPREQINQVTTYIDGSSIYGTEKMWADELRSFVGGKLRVQDGDLPPFNTHGYPMINLPVSKTGGIQPVYDKFLVGNRRANENPALFALQVVWLREHNVMAEELAAKHPDYDDEQLFQEARKWTIAKYQSVSLNEWAGVFLGDYTAENGTKIQNLDPPFPAYKGYNPALHPGILIELKAAYRFRYSLFPPAMYMANLIPTGGNNYTVHRDATGKCTFNTPTRLCNAYWNPQASLQQIKGGFEQMIIGMTSQIAEREDNVFVEDLNDYAFGPYELSRVDLVANNIQLNRDMGIPDYNTVREAFGLPRLTSFDNITSNVELAANLSKAYDGNIDDMDLFAAGIVESTKLDNGAPGKLYQEILRQQFVRIRDGDRFWYANKENGLFTDAEIEFLDNVKFADILNRALRNVANITFTGNVFINEGTKSNQCFQPEQLAQQTLNEKCTPPVSYNYGAQSVNELIITSVILFVFFVTMYLIARFAPLPYAVKQAPRGPPQAVNKMGTMKPTAMDVVEASVLEVIDDERIGLVASIQDFFLGFRPKAVSGPDGVILAIQNGKVRLLEKSPDGAAKRLVVREHRFANIVHVYYTTASNEFLVRLDAGPDLYVRFRQTQAAVQFAEALKEADPALDISEETKSLRTKFIGKGQRRTAVKKFFTAALIQAYSEVEDENAMKEIVNLKKGFKEEDLPELQTMLLSKDEFYDILKVGGRASRIMSRLFSVADKDNTDTISFDEFVAFLALFASTDPDTKFKLLFQIIDEEGRGEITKSALRTIIADSLSSGGLKVSNQTLEDLIDTLWASADPEDTGSIPYDRFRELLNTDFAQLADNVAITTMATMAPAVGARARVVAQKLEEELEEQEEREQAEDLRELDPDAAIDDSTYDENRGIKGFFSDAYLYVEKNGPVITLLILYTAACLGVMAERMYTHYVQRDHLGIRQLTGSWGLPVASGTAAVINLNFAFLFLSMCRLTISTLRSSKLAYFIPFDYSIEFHKLVGVVILIFSTVHTAAHFYNFYTLSQRSATDINCLFPELWINSDQQTALTSYWIFRTVPGVTGFLLVVGFALLYPFTIPRVRQQFRRVFWYLHQLWIPIVLLMFCHGLAHLVQPPNFWKYFIFPITLYFLDNAIRWGRRRQECAVVNVQVLPSNVISLQFERPEGFGYRSGMWLQVACPAIQEGEYHPFTITSAPEDEYLSLHIRTVGYWTNAAKKIYGSIAQGSQEDRPEYPKLYVDGPFGTHMEDWTGNEVSIMCGGGIGVTPFASILKDLIYKIRSAKKKGRRFGVKRLYFFWVSDSQANFEWFGDLLAKVEEEDTDGILRVYPYITGRFNKNDIRLTMVRLSQAFFLRVNGKDLLTGQKAKINFGRPEWFKLFSQIAEIHKGKVPDVSVYLCGPYSMSQSVGAACSKVTFATNLKFNFYPENF